MITEKEDLQNRLKEIERMEANGREQKRKKHNNTKIKSILSQKGIVPLSLFVVLLGCTLVMFVFEHLYTYVFFLFALFFLFVISVCFVNDFFELRKESRREKIEEKKVKENE